MSDFKINSDGELQLNEDGDFAIVKGNEELAQYALLALKTTKGDWVLTPNFGCDLERFIGQTIDDPTLIELENYVQLELEKNPLLFVRQVAALPEGENTIMLVIDVVTINPEEMFTLVGSLDLKTGQVQLRNDLQ